MKQKQKRHRPLRALLCTLLGVCAAAGAKAAIRHLESDELTEIAYLLGRGTADGLATASLLAHLTQVPEDERQAGVPAGPDPTELIDRAVALAPGRAELVWVQLRDCQARRCEAELGIAKRLQALDPDNGLAWLGDLNAAQSTSEDEVTRVIDRIGDAPAPRIYWNRLTVMMFDALTHGTRTAPATAITLHADDRLTHVAGVLAALDIPAFKPLAQACRADRFEESGRRAACEKAMARLEASDAVILQLVRLSVQEGWWSPAGAEGAALRRDRLQRRYLTVASNRVRKGRADSDAELRIAAMRRLGREEDVERAMLTAFHEPLERPDDWRSPTPPQP